MDRVASPWLIRRFIDPDAEFVFVPFGKVCALPDDAIPFGIPGVELGAHDSAGSTFRKILRKYEVKSRSLALLANLVESGIRHATDLAERGRSDVGALAHPEGVGIDAICLGMMYVATSDADDIEKSLVLFDALHSYCRIRLLEADKPEIMTHPQPVRWDLVRCELDSAQTEDAGDNNRCHSVF
jgi:hypothetical protein